MLDSDISADTAPFLLTFADNAESDELVEVDCWLIPFLKQSFK